MTRDSEYWPGRDLRYRALGVDADSLPLSESLKDVTKRTSLFWDEQILPQLKQRKRILIVGHENNLRSIIKRLDNISDDDILHIELPRAIPILFELNPTTFKPIKLSDAADGMSGRYLCPKEIVKEIHVRDHHQVYNLDIKSTLESVRFLGRNWLPQ
jgi:2,3-bisphosphoglycerate-dependent phosphoglycerate mutase